MLNALDEKELKIVEAATNIFSSIFIIKTSFILSISILSCQPGDINVAKD